MKTLSQQSDQGSQFVCVIHTKTVLFSSNPFLVPLKDKSLRSHQVEGATKPLNMPTQYPAVQKHTLLYTVQWNPCVDLSGIHLQTCMMESLADMYDGVTCRHVWWSHLQACMMESLAGMYGGVSCRHVWREQFQTEVGLPRGEVCLSSGCSFNRGHTDTDW